MEEPSLSLHRPVPADRDGYDVHVHRPDGTVRVIQFARTCGPTPTNWEEWLTDERRKRIIYLDDRRPDGKMEIACSAYVTLDGQSFEQWGIDT